MRKLFRRFMLKRQKAKQLKADKRKVRAAQLEATPSSLQFELEKTRMKEREREVKEAEERGAKRALIQYKQSLLSDSDKFQGFELAEWCKHPTTKKMIVVFKKIKAYRAMEMAGGSTDDKLLQRAIGSCLGMEELIEKVERGSETPENIEVILSYYTLNILNDTI